MNPMRTEGLIEALHEAQGRALAWATQQLEDRERRIRLARTIAVKSMIMWADDSGDRLLAALDLRKPLPTNRRGRR